MTPATPGFRNIAFVGHPASGKTTLVDALAHAAGAAERKGSVADKTSLCDTEPEEQDKHHTLQPSVVHAEFGGATFNLIDTPGYPDFEGEARGAMWAADLVVGVVSLSGGLTYNFRRKMKSARQMGRPRAILVTHPDAENVDFEELVMELRAAIGEICVPVLLPDLEDEGGNRVFKGVHRVVKDDGSEWRNRLMDRVMDSCKDEALLERYLETQALSEDELKENLPHAIAEECLIPIMVCDPESGIGVEEVLDFLLRAGPTPDCHEGFTAAAPGETPVPVPAESDAELLGAVFAVRTDPHVGKICYARILSGELDAHATIQNAGDDDPKAEKLGGAFHLVGGKQREPVDKVPAGGICAFSKVENLSVGDSFTAAGKPPRIVSFPGLPTPKVSLALAPVSTNDEQKVGPALAKLEAEDPVLRVRHDELTHELIIDGSSDLHLATVLARLERRYGVKVETSTPKIAYRETIRKPAEGHHRHKKQSGGRGQFGECHLRVKPGADGTGVTFVDKVVGGAIPRNLIPAVEKGIREICNEGILTHAQVVDVEIELYDGKFHQVDSDEASFKTCGARAFREAFAAAKPALLEPIMELEIHVPADHAGTVFSDITSHRRGTVVDQAAEEDGAVTIIKAHAPLSEVQTYHRELKSQTAGAGTWTMKFDHYGPVPASEQTRVLSEAAKVHAD